MHKVDIEIAVILINYNGLDYTIDCINSLKNTNHAETLRIIVVDNASKINEAELIKERFPEVHTIRSEVNEGFSAGNNIGIRYALDKRYGYVLLLNNDTVVDLYLVDKLIENCSDKYVCVPKMYYYSDPGRIWYGGGIINRKSGNAEHIKMNVIDDGTDVEIIDCSFATGCCIMVKSSVFQRVGLLDEEFFMYCEDTEFCIRLALNDVGIKYVPIAKLWHRVSSSTGGADSPFSTYYMTRNRLNYIRNYKEYFGATAYTFTLVSRYIRMIQCKDKQVKNAFKQGIRDHINGVTGKSFG